jgi:hypothetical protein
MVNSLDTVSTLGRLKSLSHNFHITCEQVATVPQDNPLVYREMMATSTDPIGETAALEYIKQEPMQSYD